jgi:hypothetical protein
MNGTISFHIVSMDIRSSISFGFLSRSSGVSMCSRVSVRESHIIGEVPEGEPHSSTSDPFSGGRTEYQQVVARKPSDKVSTRNLSSRMLSGNDGGGMKSQGTITKSSEMRGIKWRSRAHVPSLPSSPSSKVCSSIFNEVGAILECMW